ncbi:hypothetical protein HBA55_03635 [Pseudomaricurvus alkylphenolicus]|jgi:hypothetical protein|uniref:YciI family protein n=1 Tax=Pseudomaricurvus alkylphenolicus TaxID=1306991 RepID=UPI001422DFA6|nr:YciI family protein [Pseudomaricurvus alkylphenolicus]NIB38661.1 hypothetical protein [Pseudomaricurvus alkylphenolicus]
MSKKNYLCIMRRPTDGNDTSSCPPPSPDQMEQMFARFNAWKEKFKDNIVDMGGKLGEGAVVTTEGATDGPFIEAKEVVGGFMIIAAETMVQAIEVARESPGVHPGSSVEVREISTS